MTETLADKANGNHNDYSTSQLNRLKKAELIDLIQEGQKVDVVGEYPTSWHMKYRSSEGFECNIFVRGVSGAEVLSNARKATVYLVEHGATPWDYSKNGNGKPVETKPCPVHPDMLLKKYSNDRGSWWAHKFYAPDGSEKWCKGKVDENGGAS
jgi:hypothetical protein